MATEFCVAGFIKARFVGTEEVLSIITCWKLLGQEKVSIVRIGEWFVK